MHWFRSASIVSGCSATIMEKKSNGTADCDSPPATLDSCNGTLRKKQRFQFQEEIDCEELSKEIFVSQGVVNGELHDLFGKP